ncbi:TIGR04083 family peptide-modifying radical SAM enzyme [uncultured Methanosphaera sp.]|uniref:TIGR04083 family peptide-modifying radical SAM enzyme n=1 Tax=uncultured Methanosphaera sp. TaxID=262501 RepID=UPI000DC429E0|nr:TIGR04083 family peptide-modifying radical SAM enzyme [uncultured Methanosphaera sp.]RAP45255.1 MAG: putative peptide-modifying radical SAM enzyme [Methanosphaera sp. SHI1033]
MHVMIIPTMGCPANCSYCWSSETTSLVMSDKTIDDTVEWLKDFKKEPVTFTFHGGEPLLAGYDFYKHALNKIATELDFLYPAFAIQTNLWLMDDDIAELFKQYEIPVGSSLDGPKDLNDIQRGPGYYEKTLKGYEIARKHGLRVSFISTFTNYSITRKEEIFNFFKDNGFNMKIHPALPSIKSHKSDNFALEPKDYGNLLLYLLDQYLDLADQIELKNIDHLCRGVFMRRGCVCTYVDCMGSTFAVGPDGSIYPCYRFVDMPEYVIGHVSDKPTYEELMNSKAEKLLFKYKEFVDEDCKDCKHVDYCRGGCPYNALAISDHEVKCVDPHCEAYKMIFDKIDELMNQKLNNAFDELDNVVEKDYNFTLNVGFENEGNIKNGKKFTVMDIALK